MSYLKKYPITYKLGLMIDILYHLEDVGEEFTSGIRAIVDPEEERTYPYVTNFLSVLLNNDLIYRKKVSLPGKGHYRHNVYGLTEKGGSFVSELKKIETEFHMKTVEEVFGLIEKNISN